MKLLIASLLFVSASSFAATPCPYLLDKNPPSDDLLRAAIELVGSKQIGNPVRAIQAMKTMSKPPLSLIELMRSNPKVEVRLMAYRVYSQSPWDQMLRGKNLSLDELLEYDGVMRNFNSGNMTHAEFESYMDAVSAKVPRAVAPEVVSPGIRSAFLKSLMGSVQEILDQNVSKNADGDYKIGAAIDFISHPECLRNPYCREVTVATLKDRAFVRRGDLQYKVMESLGMLSRDASAPFKDEELQSLLGRVRFEELLKDPSRVNDVVDALTSPAFDVSYRVRMVRYADAFYRSQPGGLGSAAEKIQKAVLSAKTEFMKVGFSF